MIELTVLGMNCAPCARAVTDAVRSVDPDAEIDIDMNTKLVEIASRADRPRIQAAIESAGYKVEPNAV